MKQLGGSNFEFSTGKYFSANEGIIGINSDLETYEGYDGSLDWLRGYFTPKERVELADYMIELWKKYKKEAEETEEVEE